MEGILNDWEYSSLYRNSKELFTFFNKEKFQLTPEQFDFIHAIYSNNDDVICNLLSFEYEVREISEEDDLDDSID
jgi:DNA-binding MarR family transcriptional regulator